jgi:hypothetical protein
MCEKTEKERTLGDRETRMMGEEIVYLISFLITVETRIFEAVDASC